MTGEPQESHSAIEIVRAAREDATEILALQKAAYQSEAEIYGDFSIPPLVQTLAEMERDIDTQVVLKAQWLRDIVGSVRGYQEGDTVFVGRVIVRPDRQGKGLGRRLVEAIESHFSSARRFELFTGHRSIRNLAVYDRLGYRAFRSERLTGAVSLVFLEKHRA